MQNEIIRDKSEESKLVDKALYCAFSIHRTLGPRRSLYCTWHPHC